MFDIVVFSPSRLSLYTIVVTEMLRRKGIRIKALYVRRMFNPKRFFSEFGRDGSRLLKKIWRKAILRRSAYPNAGGDTIVDLMRRENICFGNVEEFEKKYGIPVVYCDDLNEPKVVEGLKETKPELVVFTGGGLIRDGILENAGAGVLNCHMGVLPQYRGMDVVEWPILEGNLSQVGMTVHFMDAGVDTGDILRIQKMEVKANESVRRLRERFEPVMCEEMVAAVLDFEAGRTVRVKQKQSDGKQYYIMHKRLSEIVESRLKSR